jgi:DNA-binding NtrC family response regulator
MMPKLRIQKSKEFLKEDLLPDTDVVVIGRTQSSDVVLPDETRRVSRFHAAMVRISSQPARYFIRDLGSGHGTSVNGAAVHQKILCDDDVIEIGDYCLAFTSLVHEASRTGRFKVVARKPDEPFTETSTIALRMLPVPDMDSLTEMQREVLEEFQYKVRRGASLSHSADAVVGAILRAVQAERGFIGLLRRGDRESLIELGATNLGEHDEIEIYDPLFSQHLLEGKVIEETATLLVPFSKRRDVTHFVCVNRQNARRSFGAQEVAFLRGAMKVLESWPSTPEDTSPIHDGEVMEWPLEMISRSKKMNEVVKQIETAAASRMNLLVLGESGSGKELVARSLHKRLSPAGQFVAKNCGQTTETLAETAIFGYAPKSGISEADPKGAPGWFELANGGTLFLDEVHRLTPAMQDKFLRVLQDKHVWRIGAQSPVVVNVNVIAATDEDLEAAVEDGSFRKPFYFRFGARIQVPPLRERREDIPLLTYFFLDKYAKILGSRARTISHRGLRILVENSWPGNIRQLEHVIQGAVAKNQEVIFSWDLEEQLREATTPPSSKATAAATAADIRFTPPSASLPRRMDEVEKEQIEEALEATQGNATKAAELLGFKSRQTILTKMDRYGIPRNYADPQMPKSNK